jgi:hypothetical protein
MSRIMKEEAMRALARELAKSIKTEKDLSDFSRQLKKMTVEAALGAEMQAHLGYAKHSLRVITQAIAATVTAVTACTAVMAVSI